MTIRSRPSTDTYRENWDRIFGRDARHDEIIRGASSSIEACGDSWFSPFHESLDSHPAAD
jgi:hypothetical protein